jgi:hypothetical protein
VSTWLITRPPTIAIPSGLRSSDLAVPDHQRQGAEERRQRRHQNRPQPQQARLVDRLERREVLLPLELQRHVDHQDRVLHHDADEEEDAEHGDDRELGLERL